MAQVAVLHFDHVQGPHYFRVRSDGLVRGMPMVGTTRFGLAVGRLSLPAYEAATLELPLDEARRATQADLDDAEVCRTSADDAQAVCRALVERHELPMKLVRSFLSLDQRQLTFFFTAPGRVDFRGLLHDLVANFDANIRLEQIGDRDCARMLGGLGRCGRCCCCAQWLPRFEPVSIVHAKEQGLAPVPGQLAGLCGKLRCCLRFEIDDADEPRFADVAGRQRRPAKTASRRGGELDYVE